MENEHKAVSANEYGNIDIGDDDLAILAAEIEELDNDELDMNEAAFMRGYHADFDDFYSEDDGLDFEG
jgi:hypothetical protein